MSVYVGDFQILEGILNFEAGLLKIPTINLKSARSKNPKFIKLYVGLKTIFPKYNEFFQNPIYWKNCYENTHNSLSPKNVKFVTFSCGKFGIRRKSNSRSFHWLALRGPFWLDKPTINDSNVSRNVPYGQGCVPRSRTSSLYVDVTACHGHPLYARTWMLLYNGKLPLYGDVRV